MGIPALTQPKRTILPAESGYDSTDPGGEGGGDWIDDGAVVTHGQIVALSGSGYGSMPQFAFAGGASGRIETTEVGLDDVDAGGFRLSDGRPKSIEDDSERGKVWRSDVYNGQTAIASNGLISHDWGSQIPSGSKVLVHWTSKINCDAPHYQWKQYRAEPTYNYSDGGPEICFFGWKKTVGKLVIWRRNATTNTDNDTYRPPAESMLPVADPVWMTYDIYDELSSENIDDGVALYETLTGTNKYTVYSNDTARHFGEGVTDRRRYHVLQNYLGNYDDGDPTQGVVWIDDFAVQVAAPGDDLVRVYLCNTDDINTSTVREYQRPVEGWANTAAKIEINRGGLADGEYYVIAVANKNTQISATRVVLS